jgi:hypothetical protein
VYVIDTASGLIRGVSGNPAPGSFYRFGFTADSLVIIFVTARENHGGNITVFMKLSRTKL